ncbi:DsbA family protein [Candidatus Woesearchaeota archaeon]|nr:DsbA family protein [Candidatus Woesearchaeota archaeon]
MAKKKQHVDVPAEVRSIQDNIQDNVQQSEKTGSQIDVQLIVKVLAGLFLLIIIISGFKGMSGGITSGVSDDGYFKGAKDAKITMIEWSDFQCPFCGKFYTDTLSQIQKDYIDTGKVKLVFKHFPLSFHENAQKAAESAECAGEQNKEKFWAMHDKMFENQEALTVVDLKKYAKELGLKEDKFNDCLGTSKYAQKVADDMQQGQKAGISGTPGFTINGVLISGAQPYENFKKVFEQILSGETPAGDEPEPSADSQLADSSKDPEILLTIVNDKNCKACVTTGVSNINQQAFKTVKETLVDISSKEGKELMKKYDIKALPFYIYDNKIKEAANFDKIQQALVEKDGSYYINPEAGVAVKLLEVPKMTLDHVKGKADAKITMIEWSDFQCPFCGKFYSETLPELQKQFIDTGQVKLVYKHFPLSFHENAQKAAEASECASEQNKEKFWAMHDKIFENQGALTLVDLKKYAADLKLDSKKFDECLDTGKYADRVKADMEVGAKVGVSGTPGFLINGIIISGAQPLAAFEELFKAELQE